jgi:hypothetical protein
LRRSGWRRSPLLGAAEQLAAHLTPPKPEPGDAALTRTSGQDAADPATAGEVVLS